MATLEPEYDPFRRLGFYEELDVDPYASSEEINAKLEELSERMEEMSDADKAQRMGFFQDLMKTLKSPRNRVLANMLILDANNTRDVLKRLAKLPENLHIDSLKMPPLDVSSILTEGENEDIARVDFQDVEEDASLEIDLDAVRDLLKQEPQPRHVTFES
jgi:hypothetical protein